jgi:hypothetical protein
MGDVGFSRTRSLAWALLLGIVVLPAGCRTPLPFAEDVASAHIAVLSVAHWEDYVDALQPTFKLSPEDALKKVLPTTTREEQKLLDALQASLRIALPRSSDSTKTTTTPKEGTTTTATEERGPGNLADVATGASIVQGRKASDLAGFGIEGDLGLDPMMQYRTATSLYQEVQLLNRYVRNAARLRGYAPYMVRVQISLMPESRDKPFDALTNLAFFTGPDPIESGRGAAAPAAEMTLRYKERYKPLEVSYVIPLLVTDSVESAMRSRTEDIVRQFVVAVGAMVQGFGGAAESQRLKDDLERTLGREFNSLLTVGRLSHNTVRVRLGAVRRVQDRDGKSRYSMVPQTHCVTLLLLVPLKDRKCPEQMHLVARTTFSDVVSGVELTAGPDKVWKHELDKQGDKYNWTGDLNQEDVNLLMLWARDDLYTEYVRELDRIVEERLVPKVRERYAHARFNADEVDRQIEILWRRVRDDQDSIWTDLVSLNAGSRHDFVKFDLPEPLKPWLPPQAVPLVDDGKKAIAAVRGGKDLRASRIRARLTVNDPRTSSPTEGDNFLYADSVEVKDGGSAMSLTFPSLKALGFLEAPKKKAGESPPVKDAGQPAEKEENEGKDQDPSKRVRATELLVEFDTAQDSWQVPSAVSLVAVEDKKTLKPVLWVVQEPEKPAPGFTVTCGARSIVPDRESRATVQTFWILKDVNNDKAPLEKVFVGVEGADLLGITGTPAAIVVLDGGRWSVLNDGVATVSLGHLVPGSKVVLRAAREKGTPAVLEFDVREGPTVPRPPVPPAPR